MISSQFYPNHRQKGVISIFLILGVVFLISFIGAGTYVTTDRFTNFSQPDFNNVISRNNPLFGSVLNMISPSASPAANTTTNDIPVTKIDSSSDLNKVSQVLNDTNYNSLDDQLQQLNSQTSP